MNTYETWAGIQALLALPPPVNVPGQDALFEIDSPEDKEGTEDVDTMPGLW